MTPKINSPETCNLRYSTDQGFWGIFSTVEELGRKSAKSYSKLGNGIKKAGRWVRDKVLPVVGRIAKPVLNIISALPGKLGMIGKVGSAVTGLLHGATEKIPNQGIKDKLNRYIDKGSDKFQHVVDKGREISDDVNRKIGVGKDIANHLKEGYNNVIKPAVPALKINPLK